MFLPLPDELTAARPASPCGEGVSGATNQNEHPWFCLDRVIGRGAHVTLLNGVDALAAFRDEMA